MWNVKDSLIWLFSLLLGGVLFYGFLIFFLDAASERSERNVIVKHHYLNASEEYVKPISITTLLHSLDPKTLLVTFGPHGCLDNNEHEVFAYRDRTTRKPDLYWLNNKQVKMKVKLCER